MIESNREHIFSSLIMLFRHSISITQQHMSIYNLRTTFCPLMWLSMLVLPNTNIPPGWRDLSDCSSGRLYPGHSTHGGSFTGLRPWVSTWTSPYLWRQGVGMGSSHNQTKTGKLKSWNDTSVP